MKTDLVTPPTFTAIVSLLITCSCGADPAQPPVGSAGTPSTAGASSGGAPSGGTSSGGTGAGTGPAVGGSAGTTSTAGTGGAGGGAGFGNGGAPPGSPTFTQVAAILQANCGSKCHSGERQDIVNLAATDPGALYARLTSPLDTDLCYQAVPVERGSAAASLIARVVKAEVTRPCVLPRMPAGCADNNECLSDADIAIIDGWINAGAFQN
ncbi:MAG TPA: hypothetical protein VHP33_30755 [Polyangiaceae bacterium]|nr:hypothetical protein [Polyangiaceae bacterium]